MHLAISLGLLCWLTGLLRAQCYSYTGVEMDSTYIPCNGSVPVSMCCRLGVTDNNGGDKCGSGSAYGLCGITVAQLWRESCTDKTWQSPLCLKLCVGDGSYCCGRNAEECCNAKEGKFIVNNQVSDTAVADSSSTQTSQPTYVSLAAISIHASEFGSSSTSAVTMSTVAQSNDIQTSVMITTVYRPLPTSTSQYT
ncbi:7fc5f4b0-6a8d-467a-bfba-76adbaad6734-CDS [Sclerotinia trifoliorum]|uniref:7fc5f4b0-6a8d-467a-bfba-76adbaad6734-CDS n=1 Tax=Sclerotinia trifoliorum TaxID=28548 RepID=A0A8H2VWX4_9HELO|nr:7fc5f4b0-6a8d-467a-bfba-76adbaad6734-CDS [Sclerotinia trifoliorum]